MLTASQIEARRAGVGGSDIPILLGYYADYGKTPFTLWQDKMGHGEPQEENENMKRGNEREPVIRKAVEHLLETPVIESPVTIYHADYPWVLCHVDGLIGEYAPVGVLEIKCPSSYSKLKEAWAVQLQWNMMACDLQWGHVAWEYETKDGGRVLTISPRIERDTDLCIGLIELTKRFWKTVAEKEWNESWNKL